MNISATAIFHLSLITATCPQPGDNIGQDVFHDLQWKIDNSDLIVSGSVISVEYDSGYFFSVMHIENIYLGSYKGEVISVIGTIDNEGSIPWRKKDKAIIFLQKYYKVSGCIKCDNTVHRHVKKPTFQLYAGVYSVYSLLDCKVVCQSVQPPPELGSRYRPLHGPKEEPKPTRIAYDEFLKRLKRGIARQKRVTTIK